jgi:putative transposase
MCGRGLSERRGLQVIGMSASSLRYEPRPDGAQLQERIVALARRHRRYGSEMIYLKLQLSGQRANHKRVERLYALEKLQVRRRRRKKIPFAERQPLVRPGAANEVLSIDFLSRISVCERVVHLRPESMGSLRVRQLLESLA